MRIYGAFNKLNQAGALLPDEYIMKDFVLLINHLEFWGKDKFAEMLTLPLEHRPFANTWMVEVLHGLISGVEPDLSRWEAPPQTDPKVPTYAERAAFRTRERALKGPPSGAGAGLETLRVADARWAAGTGADVDPEGASQSITFIPLMATERGIVDAIQAMYGRLPTPTELDMILDFVEGRFSADEFQVFTGIHGDSAKVMLRAVAFIKNGGYITDESTARDQLENAINAFNLPPEFIEEFSDPTSPISHAAYRNAAMAPDVEVDGVLRFNTTRKKTFGEWVMEDRLYPSLAIATPELALRMNEGARQEAAEDLAGKLDLSRAERVMVAMGLPKKTAVALERIPGESHTDYLARVVGFLNAAAPLTKPSDNASLILGVDVPDTINSAELFTVLQETGVIERPGELDPEGFPAGPGGVGGPPTPFDAGFAAIGGLSPDELEERERMRDEARAVQLVETQVHEAMRAGDTERALELMQDIPIALELLQTEFAVFSEEQAARREEGMQVAFAQRGQAREDLPNLAALQAELAALQEPVPPQIPGPDVPPTAGVGRARAGLSQEELGRFRDLTRRVQRARRAQEFGFEALGMSTRRQYAPEGFSSFVSRRSRDVFGSLAALRVPEQDTTRPVRRTIFSR